jgi:hypothetical protein
MSKMSAWPIVDRTPAKKSSKNRPTGGTWETKPVNADWASYRQLVMIEKVLPEIKRK